MLKVKITELDEEGNSKLIGIIGLSNGKWNLDPKDDSTLKSILSESILDFSQEDVKEIKSDKEPEKFLRNLHSKYRNPYLMASKAY